MVYSVVTIHAQPENTTACRGSDVAVSCGYVSDNLPVTWIINGTSFTQQEVVDSPSYQLNNPTDPIRYSLTVLSINVTTTFQCIVYATNDMKPINITSTTGTVTVIGMYTCTVATYLPIVMVMCGLCVV